MNKKFLLAGFVLAAGFVTLTAFGGKTLEQQKQEIAAAVTAKLDEFRAQKEEECTNRVNTEAQTRFQTYLTEKEAAAAAAKPTVAKSGTKKKPTTVKKDPLPQTKPADNTNRSRGDAVNPTNNRERGDAVNPTSKDATKPADNRRRGDAVKSGGGN